MVVHTEQGRRSRKLLACTAAASAYQKAFGKELKRRVVDEREHFVIAQADTPHEIFHAMDIPVVSNQWWSAYISAKRLSERYFAALDELTEHWEAVPESTFVTVEAGATKTEPFTLDADSWE